MHERRTGNSPEPLSKAWFNATPAGLLRPVLRDINAHVVVEIVTLVFFLVTQVPLTPSVINIIIVIG